MSSLKLIPISLVILTILFKEISSQNCHCHHQRSNNLVSLSPTSMNTEVLCKDLASAIQSVVISKMRSNSGLGPILGTPASLMSTSGHIHSTPGSQLSTNSINDLPNPGPCPVCASNWQNSLARVLGLANNNLGQKSSSVAVSGASPVNVPLPYSAFISLGATGLQEYSAPAPKNVNVPNIYPLPELGANNVGAKSIGANNLAMLLGSIPNNGNMYSGMVMIGNNMPMSNLRNFP